MTDPAEHSALARVTHQIRLTIDGTDYPYLYFGRIEDVIGALRVLLADPGVRGDVLVALGMEAL